MKRIFLLLLLLAAGSLAALTVSPPELTQSYRQANDCNQVIYLNGIWQIALDAAKDQLPADSAYAPVAVPSSWMFAADFPIDSPEFVRGKWGGDSTYKGRKMEEYNHAFYLRKFVASQVKADQQLMLAVDRVTIKGTVYLNGQKLGDTMERFPGLYDITKLVKPGENELVILVDANLDGGEKMYMGAEMTVDVKRKATLRGLTGDVRLLVRPSGLRVDDIFVKTSVRQHKITFDTVLANPDKLQKTVTISYRIQPYQKTETVKTFEAAVTLDGSETQKVSNTFDWSDPVLWETDAPYLYQVLAAVTADGKLADRSLPRRFGFRELWIDGKETMLNGKPFRVITLSAPIRDAFATASLTHLIPVLELYKKANFNSVMISNEYAWRAGGCAQSYDQLLEYTDTHGWLVSLPLLRTYDINWNSPAERAVWLKLNRELIERYQNCPSLVFLSMNFNLLGYPWDLNPYAWADDFRPADKINDLGRRRKEAGESEKMIRNIDDTRLVYHHAGGNYGDILTSNFYISWPPLQERADYLEPWSQRGVRPFNAVELGFPNWMDYMRCRDGNWMTMTGSEPMEAEYSTPYLGRDAYKLQEDKYLKIIDGNATGEVYSNCDFYKTDRPYVWNYNMVDHAPVNLVQQKVSPFYTRIWRAYGVNGFCPWVGERDICGTDFEYWKQGVKSDFVIDDWTLPGPKALGNYRTPADLELCDTGKAYAKSFADILIFVGGSVKEGFSSQSHAYYAGEKIEKQLVVVNDSRHDLDFSVAWTLGKTSGKIPVKVAAGRRLFIPFALTMPEVTQKTALTLTLGADGLTAKNFDVQNFDLQVFPADQPMAQQKLLLFDPAGVTAKAFQRLKIAYTPLDTAKLAPGEVIVIGRDSLKEMPYADLAKCLAFVRDGNRMIVMAQRDLSIFGIRLFPRGVRQMFAVGDDPLLKGLDSKDLSDWQGDFSFLEPSPKYSEDKSGEYPEEPFRRGNRGSVASMMIEKPHAGRFQHLLEGEFDLNFALLSEIAEGKGDILFCQLDLDERAGSDPVATMLLRRLADWQPVTGQAPQPLQCIGKNALALAERLGVKIAADSSLVLVDADALTDAVWQKAMDGGKVFVLGPLPATLKIGNTTVNCKTVEAYRAAPSAELENQYGIGYSELFVKSLLKMPLIEAAPGVKLLSEPGLFAEVDLGKGKVFLIAVNPETFRNQKLSPERNTRAAVRLGRAVAMLLNGENTEFTLLAEKAAQGGAAMPITLPEVWKFAIDPANSGFAKGFSKTDFDDRAWRDLKVPGNWENQGVVDPNPMFPEAKKPYDGYAWYRCHVEIPESCKGRKLYLNLGVIDDMDKVFFNGVEIGSTSSNVKDYWAVKRSYLIPAELVRYGQGNSVVVKVFDNYMYGGIIGPDPSIQIRSASDYPYTDGKLPFNPYRLKRW